MVMFFYSADLIVCQISNCMLLINKALNEFNRDELGRN